jgi:hypothetical protein
MRDVFGTRFALCQEPACPSHRLKCLVGRIGTTDADSDRRLR